MPTGNAEIAAVLDEIADILEIEAANPFRVRAYREAARIVARLGEDVTEILGRGEDLSRLKGIGRDLASKITEIATTGRSAVLEELHRKVPEAITELLRIPALGPKRVHALYHDLEIQTLEQLHRAATDGRIRGLKGFSEKLERQILEAVEAVRVAPTQLSIAAAAAHAEPLIAYLEGVPGVGHVTAAGSYRRRRETVGDLDILATADTAGAVMQNFIDYADVGEVVARGPTRSTVILRSGLQVDLRVVAESYGAALAYFTGSKAHNIAIRRLGQERGLQINEYGVFRDNKRIAGATEESVFAAVGLPWIPPELRENAGEIEAAKAKGLPNLITRNDLRGDLHVHTTATDGRNSIREMAMAARALGLQYIAITDHSRRVTDAHSLTPDRLLAQIEEIDHMNAEGLGVTILKGVEVDILEDGSLDLPDEILGRLDLVIGAVHSKFELSREQQTRRILRAMDHPHFTILAHPTGRLLAEREPYDVDMSRIIRHARERGCFLELNARPERLDLLDVYCREAKRVGVLVSINSDAHSSHDFSLLDWGIGQARRGWLEAKDVLNTRPLLDLRRLLAHTM